MPADPNRPTPTIEAMCRAWWDRHANIPWDECPEAWKPFYRESMEAALARVGLGSAASVAQEGGTP